MFLGSYLVPDMFNFNVHYWPLEYDAELTQGSIVLIFNEIQCHWHKCIFQCHNSSCVRKHIFQKGLEIVPRSFAAFETYFQIFPSFKFYHILGMALSFSDTCVIPFMENLSVEHHENIILKKYIFFNFEREFHAKAVYKISSGSLLS